MARGSVSVLHRRAGGRRPWIALASVPLSVISLCSVITAATADTASAATTDSGPTVVAGWGQFRESRYTATAVPPTTELPDGVEASALAAGGDFAMALGSDGAVYTWGYNAAGELGTAQGMGGLTPIFDPVRVNLPNGATATSIAASSTGGSGPGRAFAVGSDGVAYHWGASDYCNSANSDVPVALPLPAGVHARQVAGNTVATFVLGDDGNVYSTGSNYLGNLGTGSTASQDCTPGRVALPVGVTATAIDAGGQFALAAGSDGDLYAWGDNSQGQLGMGFTTGGSSSTPVWVRIPDGVVPTAIAAGNAHGLAAGSDGRLYAWGENAFGALGDGATRDQTEPIPVALPDGVTPTAVSASNQSLAVGSDGQLYGWGYNFSGELGDTATTTRLIPAPVALPDGARIGAISAGPYFSLALVDAVAPQFTGATPPTTATAGSTLDYTFAASGLPAPSYRLADGAPSWLHIDPSSGELTGTLPSDAGTFGFSVTATNLAGTATAGPFTVTVPLHPIHVAGTVDADGRPVEGALVDVCVTGGSVCQHATTDAAGAFTVMMTPNTSVEVTAYPPQGSGLDRGTSGGLFVPLSGLDAVAVHLPALTLPAAGLSATSGQVGTAPGGQPVFHWAQAATLRASNCANGTGLITLVGENTSTGQYEYHAYPLTEDPAGSGEYTGTLPPQYPIHGPVEIKQTVTCAGQSGVQPQSGLTAGGESITISGAGVGGATAVQFGTVAATDLQSFSDDLLTVTAPAGTGTVPVLVTLASGDTVPAGEYTYVAANDVPGLDQASYQAATAATTTGPTPQAQVQPESAGAVRLTVDSATPMAGLLSDTSSNSNTLATIGKWVYNHFPGGTAATVRSAIATAMLAVNPTCDSDRAALKASVHLAVAAAVMLLIAQLSPFLVIGAEALLSALVDPIIAGLLEPTVAWLVAKLVGVILNKMVDAMLDAAIDAALGRCPNHQTNALIDPSGTVLDTNGNPVSGATVTILRSDSETGPFTPVDVTQPGIEPATNPETTATDGVFHWDVRSGYYEVQAHKAGCTVPGHADQDTATTGPMPVPPPQLGLTITLACPDELPTPTPMVTALTVATGPPAGGTDVVVSGSGFTPDATVTVGGVPAASVTYFGPNAIAVTTPAHAVGPADVVVHTGGGDSAISSADQFSYGTIPVVTGLNATSGPVTGGTVVTITGSGFTGATVVGFGGMAGTDLSVISDTRLTVTTPAVSAGGAVDVNVITPIGVNPPGDPATFTYIDQPAPVCSAVTATARPKRDTTVQLSCTGEGVVYDLPGQPEHGTLSGLDAATGTITYTAAAKYVGTDTFTYTAHNAGGTSVPVTVTVTVTHRNTGNHGKSGSHRNSGNKGGNSPAGN